LLLLVGAVVLAAGGWIGIRFFVWDFYSMPTGSMAPTIIGEHYEIECPSCHARFPVVRRANENGSLQLSVQCPLCGKGSEHRLGAEDVRSGDQIRVSRLATIGRFDVIVFRYPMNPSRSFVKRVVGLPGETIHFDERGDLLVKVGEKWAISRKPPEVQEALWFPVHDSRFTDPATPAWKLDDAARWSITRDPAKGQILSAAPGKGGCSLELARPIVDGNSYNGRIDGPAVGDVRVIATVTPGRDAGSITLAIVENGQALAAELPIGPGKTRLSRGRAALAETDGSGLSAGVPATIAFSYVDERAAVVVDGREVLTWDDPAPAPSTTSSTVRLMCGAGGATFADVRVDRDIVWTPGFGPQSDEVTLPADGYFVVGDNVPNSEDSRKWGPVARSFVIGRVSYVWLPFDRAKTVH
jgi:signal peptidase I